MWYHLRECLWKLVYFRLLVGMQMTYYVYGGESLLNCVTDGPLSATYMRRTEVDQQQDYSLWPKPYAPPFTWLPLSGRDCTFFWQRSAHPDAPLSYVSLGKSSLVLTTSTNLDHYHGSVEMGKRLNEHDGKVNTLPDARFLAFHLLPANQKLQFSFGVAEVLHPAFHSRVPQLHGNYNIP
jgi:hypothetical protein